MNCNVDQQESSLYFSSLSSLDSGQVLAIVGTLATETGNAVYVGLSANDASILGGVANVMDTDVMGPDGPIKGLKASADRYAISVNNTGKFFVHSFTKDCTVLPPVDRENCSPTNGVDPSIGDPGRSLFIFTIPIFMASILLTPTASFIFVGNQQCPHIMAGDIDRVCAERSCDHRILTGCDCLLAFSAEGP